MKEFIKENNTKLEMLEWLRDESLNDIKMVCSYIYNETDYNLSVTGTKEFLISQLKDVSKKYIWQAIDYIFPDTDEESLTKVELANIKKIGKMPSLLEKHQKAALEKIEKYFNTYQGEFILSLPTGAGKTRTAAILAIRKYLSEEKTVLWVTFNGDLLKQAIEEFKELGIPSKIIGKNGNTKKLKEITQINEDHFLIFSTINSLTSKSDFEENLRWINPELIIVDEIHWGVDAKMYSKLYKWITDGRRNIDLLGLSATPKENKWFGIDSKNNYSMSFGDAVKEKIILPPQIFHVKTNTVWVPDFKNKMVLKSSYEELGKKDIRNDIIANEYIKNKEKYGKTLIFACSIEHADRLCSLIDDKKNFCSTYHSGETSDEENLEKFKNNELQVLITIEMCTHGVSINDIKTIFLARPTESESLFMQMIGRGSRNHTGKEYFNLVEFTDTIKNFQDMFITTKIIPIESIYTINENQKRKNSTTNKKEQTNHHRKIISEGKLYGEEQNSLTAKIPPSEFFHINNYQILENITCNKTPEEICEVGKCYEYGKNNTVIDYDLAFKCYLLAAGQGSPEAQYRLGNLFFQGKGTDKNDEYSILWIKKAAEQKYKEAEDALVNFSMKEKNDEILSTMYGDDQQLLDKIRKKATA